MFQQQTAASRPGTRRIGDFRTYLDPEAVPAQDPYYTLARAVITRAIEDLQLSDARLRKEAMIFLLQDRKSLSFWCERAELDPDVVVAGVKKLLATTT